VILLRILILCLISLPLQALTPFPEHKDVTQFIQHMSKKHAFSTQKLQHLFKKLSPDPKVITLISKPFEEKTWAVYQKWFLSKERVQAGVQFWKEHAATLKRAEQTFGVPAEIIVAILGVETYYGKELGKYPVLQSLATLAFHYPKRAAFFRSELEQFLLLTQEEGIDPSTVMGSYAGAMGKPQFIASSYRHYAIDFAQIGKRDLMHDTVSAIGSVANYFKSHGWKAGQPIVCPGQYLNQPIGVSPKNNPKPVLTLPEIKAQGIIPTHKIKLNAHEHLALLILQGAQGSEPWLGLHNFYVITRYNHSVNYAMAVYQLSQRIRASR
jgi:membrane-bound lytic murein transglycosylase B